MWIPTRRTRRYTPSSEPELSTQPPHVLPLTAAVRADLAEKPHQPPTAVDFAMWRYADGDGAAFSELYDHLAPALRRYLRRRTGDDQRAADLAQETYLRMHCHRAQFTRGARVKPWAFAIATNLSKDDDKKRRRFSAVFDDWECPSDAGDSSTPTADQIVRARQLEQKLRAELDLLPDGQRLAFELLQLDGMSQQEAAECLGTTVSTIKSSSHRAYTALRAALAQFQGGAA
jgi:RNA polymerase sigma-70 factor (ECF subfamily)